jgi:VWFA-related protein
MNTRSARHRAPAARLLVPLGSVALAAAAVLAAQSTPQQQKPVPFRTGVNFVRVDVYPTAPDGRHVGDLEAAEFEILENGVPQKIETFEHVAIKSGGTPDSERVDPDSTRTEKALAADPRNRLFVLFLDSDHVTDNVIFAQDRAADGRVPASRRRDGPPMAITTALTGFLEKMLGPDDLVAMMTPDMAARSIVFVRRPSSLEEFLQSAWAARFAPGRSDPEEQEWLRCWGGDPIDEAKVTARREADSAADRRRDLLERAREDRSIRAARDLVEHLRTVREERKAVLLVSEGWMLYRPDLSTAGRTPLGPQGVYVGPGGKPGLGKDPREAAFDYDRCSREASRLSQLDGERDFRSLMDEANRANTTFYPIDPRGLAASDAMERGAFKTQRVPYGKDAGLDAVRDMFRRRGYSTDEVDAALAGSAIADLASLRVRLETMQTLAENTDGLTLLSNDLGSVMQRIVDDTSAYYLIGYSSTNAKPDGSFRRIAVRVTRPGVTVRARRGYRAATRDDLAASRAAAAAVADPALEPVRNAIASASAFRDGAPFAAEVGHGCAPAGPDGARAAGAWVVGEITASGGRDVAWQSGAAVEIAVADEAGRSIGSERRVLSATERAVMVALPLPVSPGGQSEYSISVSAHPAGASALPVKQTLRLRAPAASANAALCVGTAALARRGPFTRNVLRATADPRYRRQERARVEVPVDGSVDSFTATLIDRAGKPLALPMTASDRKDASGWRWIGGELALAPLAAGDYVVQIEVVSGTTRQKILRALRVVP